MIEEKKPTIRKVVFIVLILIASTSLLSSYNISRRYEALQAKYVDQVIEHNDLVKEHTQLTDAYWSLQQSILKQ